MDAYLARFCERLDDRVEFEIEDPLPFRMLARLDPIEAKQDAHQRLSSTVGDARARIEAGLRPVLGRRRATR